MLRFIHGFDLDTFFENAAKMPQGPHNLFAAQGDKPAGRDPAGHSWRIFNTLFQKAEYTRTLPDAPAKLFIGFNWAPSNGTATLGYAHPFQDWFQITKAGVVAITLRLQGDGSLQLLVGNSVKATLAGPYALDVWVFVELVLDFPGKHIELWIEKTKQVDLTGVAGMGTGADGIRLRWANFGTNGFKIDDLYCCDGQGTILNQRLGPCRVSSMFPTAEQAHGWGKAGSGTPATAVIAVDDRLGHGGPAPGVTTFPDGDVGYIAPSGALALETFTMSKPPCYGQNLAVVLNSVSRFGASGAGTQSGWVKQLGPIVKIGSTVTLFNPVDSNQSNMAAAMLNYYVYQYISQLSPASGSPWTDVEIATSFWGIKNESGNDQHCTCLYLEKLTSLDPALLFDCGTGSYVY